ncbi:MAG: hypothetical protein CSA53_04185 [Gammaproteobacteria bacterium]|nr:MAG: hypothetical protein CSA53_04185 [Gammaproteobacteria bacterium]
MKILRSTLAAMAFFLVCTQACFAAPIFYERADLGAGRYELSYTVDNQTSFAITEFTIWFDLGLYDNLAITSSPVDWDGLAAQPDPGLPDDGFADWLSLGLAIAPGVSLGGFSVAFDWLGTGLPGAQFFEIVDPDTFVVLESGFTQPLLPVAAVPEPPALVLLALGLLLLIGSIDRRVKRRVKTACRWPSLLALMSLSLASGAAAGTDELTAIDQELLQKERVGRAYFDYTYRLHINNAGEALSNVSASLTSNTPNTTVIDGEVVFGNIGSGESVSSDTFTIRQNRRVPFDSSALSWQFSADVAVGDNPPVITSSPITLVALDTPYVYQVTAEDSDAGDSLRFSLLVAPAGMTIDDTTGLIQWQPTSTNAEGVDVQVTDSTGLTDRQVFVIRVNHGAEDLPPLIQPIADQSISVGETLTVQVSASDPEGDALRYGLQSAPAGMVINALSGTIQWQPAAADVGLAQVVVTATDPGGQSASTDFTVAVAAHNNNQPPSIDAVAAQWLPVNSPWQLTLSGSDPDPQDILTYSIAGLPAGVQVNGSTGTVYWLPTPQQEGSYTAVATVTDSAGASDATEFSVQVVGAPVPPVAVNDSYVLAQRSTLQVDAPGVLANDSDANNDPLTASLTIGPLLGSLDSFPGDGGFSYTPPASEPITIGLQQQCAYHAVGVWPPEGVAVADIDADGAIEMVFASGDKMAVVDAASCEGEVFSIGAGEDIGTVPAKVTATLVNLDDDPDLEIVLPYLGSHPVVSSVRPHIMALNKDGSPVWTNRTTRLSESVDLPNSGGILYYGQGPVPVDLDGDGAVELIQFYWNNASDPNYFRRRTSVVAYDGSTGNVLWKYLGEDQHYVGAGISDRNPVIADLDLDGQVEIIWNHHVLNADGSLKYQLPVDRVSGSPDYLISAVANFDNDPYAEIVAYSRHYQYLFEHTGALKWKIDRPLGGSTSAYSNIVVAQLDEDPQPEYVVSRKVDGSNPPIWALYAYDTDGSELWNQYDVGVSFRFANRTATTAFDLDGDGIDELVTRHPPGVDDQPERGLAIFSGRDGSMIANAPGLFGRDEIQAPTVADMDGDGAAEIIAVHERPFGNGFEVRVYGGLPGNPFAPARSIRNQVSYQPTLVNDDGSIPAYPQPHWLIPGLNKYFAAPVIPGESPDTVDQFHYVANDGLLDSNEAQVSITLAVVNAPKIISTPPAGASPGFEFSYGGLATDADFGDVFTWTLVDAPAGMTVDELGIVRWTPEPTDLGPVRVSLVVTDSEGNTDSQSFIVQVAPPVTVPNLLGADRDAATTALVDVGLAAGNITEAFSLDVAAGQVSSQSLTPGSEAAAGSFVDFVVSLGPPPIFMPDLTALTATVAETQLLNLGLALGSVSYENHPDVPAGLIVSQAIAAGTNVSLGTVVDIVLSGGPALALQVNQALLAPGETVTTAVTAFTPSGAAAALPDDLVLAIVPQADATGAVPSWQGGTTVTAAADSLGSYVLRASSASLGVVAEETLLVAPVLAADAIQSTYADFSAQLQQAQAISAGLNEALINNDVTRVSQLASDLVVLRASLDLDALRQTPAVAFPTGFLPQSPPDYLTTGDPIFAAGLTALIGTVAVHREFLEQIIPGAGRDDDVRARFLNTQLSDAIDRYQGVSMTRRRVVTEAAKLHALLSVELPRLLGASMDHAITTLQSAGFVLNPAVTAGELYAAIEPVQPPLLTTQPAFFTAVGQLSAMSIRSTLIDKVYKSALIDIIKNTQNLILAGLVRELMPVQDIPGIITGASLSFHVAERGNSIVEAYSYFPYPDAYTVYLVGPTLLADLAEVLNSISDLQFTSMAAAADSFASVREAAETAQETLGDGFAVAYPEWVENGCALDTVNPECQQLLFGEGLPSVHKDGSFPGPVFIVVQDAVSGQISIGNFLFMPSDGKRIKGDSIKGDSIKGDGGIIF